MAYLASTRIYHLPILSGIGLDIQGAPLFVDPQQEQVYAQTVENQLYGIINMHNGGNGVIIEGEYTNVSTTIPIVKVTGVQAFINQIHVYDRDQGFVFSGLSPGVSNYLFLELIETLDTLVPNPDRPDPVLVIGDQSSRVLGDAKTVVSTSPNIGPNSILLSSVVLDYQGYGMGGYGQDGYGHSESSGDFFTVGVDLAPPGKIHLTSVLEHAADNTDPHGLVLIVDFVQSSGVGVAGTTIAENVTVLNDLFIQNTLSLQNIIVSGLRVNSNLEVFGPAVFSGQTFIPSLLNGGDETFDILKVNSLVSRSTSTFVRPIDIQSGGTLGNTLQVASGITIDGIDISSLKFLTNGSEADNNGVNTLGHTHHLGGVKYLFISPEFSGIVSSGVQLGTLTTEYDDRNNYYRWASTNATGQVRVVTKQVVPADFVTFSGITLLTRTSAGLSNTSGISFSLIDSVGNVVNKQFIKRPDTEFSETRLVSGISGNFIPGRYFGMQFDFFGELNETVDLSEIVASYNNS